MGDKKAAQAHLDALLGGHLLGDLQGEAICVIELKGGRAVDDWRGRGSCPRSRRQNLIQPLLACSSPNTTCPPVHQSDADFVHALYSICLTRHKPCKSG